MMHLRLHEKEVKEAERRAEKERKKALRLKEMKNMPVIKRTKQLLNEMNKNGDFLKKGAVYFIENIDAKLMVTNTETNYDSVLAEQGSHQLSISDFY